MSANHVCLFNILLNVDIVASMALRCLALLFAPIKTKKLEEDIPFIMKVVPVSCIAML